MCTHPGIAGDTPDEELAALAQQGLPEALDLLLRRYRRLARSKARTYFLVGADADDIEQEGLIGLYKAVRDFRPDHQSSFRAFAELCVTRQVISAIKAATRYKHRPLNHCVPLSTSHSGDEAAERDFEELLADHWAVDPADDVVSKERIADLRSLIAASLSSLEVEVLQLYAEGRSYQEIAVRLGRRSKSIDNALQRIKRKLEGHRSGVPLAA